MKRFIYWTRSHPWNVGLVGLTLLWSVCMIVNTTHAQSIDPLQPIQVYTTADPTDPDMMGLATPYGRFAVISYCDWLSPGMNVREYPNDYQAPWLGISSTDASEPSCTVYERGRRSLVACFINDSGNCDYEVERS